MSIVLLCASVAASDEAALYRKRSRDQGISAFDLTVTETSRTPRTSVLNVPGFHDRSAAASRWLMCVYTDLAIQRGSAFWAVVYPEPPKEDLLVGFPKTEKEELAALGREFSGVGEDAPIVGSVENFGRLCGMEKAPRS